MVLRFAAWLPVAVAVLLALRAIGYRIEDNDFERLIEAALIVE